MGHHSDDCDDVELLAVAALEVTGGVLSFLNRSGFKSTATLVSTGVYQLTLRDDHHASHLVIQATRNSVEAGSIQAVPGTGKTDLITVYTYDAAGVAADANFSISVTHAK